MILKTEEIICRILKYDPDQVRDEEGRWVSGALGQRNADRMERIVDKIRTMAPMNSEGRPFSAEAKRDMERGDLPRGAAYVNNPVPFDPRATPEFFTNVTDARFRDEGKNEVIDVDRLKTGQVLVNSERLVNIVRSGSVVHSTSYVRDPSWRSQPNELAVVKHGNDYFIWNGNHRAAAAMLMGQKRVAVRVLEA